jgi:hypothetical protein
MADSANRQAGRDRPGGGGGDGRAEHASRPQDRDRDQAVAGRREGQAQAEQAHNRKIIAADGEREGDQRRSHEQRRPAHDLGAARHPQRDADQDRERHAVPHPGIGRQVTAEHRVRQAEHHHERQVRVVGV